MSTELIIKLRQMTGAGIMACKLSLQQSNNNLDKACQLLRKKGLTGSIKKINRVTNNGIIYSYIHNNNSLGVLVEVNCETDFVARNESFINFVKEIAMQIAAMNPIYISRQQIPLKVIESEKQIYYDQLTTSKINKDIWEQIINGKLEKFYSQVCLYDQIYIRDNNKTLTIKNLLLNSISTLGENISVKRFSRFCIGED
ncbi:MAG: elongation factor Ts [Endomicrobium sp.]|jgi:elongation factor Ts|nr:elongation factor Ts [Endomicrobium sp.]